jgi:hypothetical protein
MPELPRASGKDVCLSGQRDSFSACGPPSLTISVETRADGLRPACLTNPNPTGGSDRRCYIFCDQCGLHLHCGPSDAPGTADP